MAVGQHRDSQESDKDKLLQTLPEAEGQLGGSFLDLAMLKVSLS